MNVAMAVKLAQSNEAARIAWAAAISGGTISVLTESKK